MLSTLFCAAVASYQREDPGNPQPPADPRCPGCYWGARIGGGSAATPGHLRPLGAHAAHAGPPVEELHELPSPALLYEHARSNRPFVVRGGLRGQAPLRAWTDAYMAREFGSSPVEVEWEKKEDRFGRAPVEWPLRRYIAQKGRAESRDALYVVHDLTPRMLREWRVLKPLACRETRMQKVLMWFSSGGTVSGLHNDGYENFLTMLAGRKRVLLFDQGQSANLYAVQARVTSTSPIDVDAVDMTLFPRAARLRYREVELHEGDMLYIPKWYWHQVRSFPQAGAPVGERRNLAVNFWWRYAFDYDAEMRGQISRIATWPNFAAVKRAKSYWPRQAPCTPLPPSTTYADINLGAQSPGGEEQDGAAFFSTGVANLNDGGADDGVGGVLSEPCQRQTGSALCGDTNNWDMALGFAPYYNVTQALFGNDTAFYDDAIARLRSWSFNTI
eukprot:g6899.t1